MLGSILRRWDEIIDMVLDLFTFKNPEKNSEEVGEEETQPDMTICPEVVYCTVQVNLCQKLFFLQNMGRTCCVQNCSECQKQFLYTKCSPQV